MKLFHILTLMLCLQTPMALANEEIIDKAVLAKFIRHCLEENNKVLAQLFQQCIEKTVYAGIGTIAALCGCFLATAGVKRTICETGKKKSGLMLTAAGIATVFIGLNIATST